MMSIDPVKLTQDLIKCPSVTPQDDGALDVVARVLEPMGFSVTRLLFEEEGTAPVENIFARLGSEGPHLCFLGHTDVVPAGRESDWTHPPFAAEIAEGKLYGRGASDMKSGIACFAAAVSRFLENNKDFKGSISLLITGDEEAEAVNGTVKVIDWMRENGQMPDVALVGEPSNPKEMGESMRIGRRGSWNGRLMVDGRQGHSAYPDRADNPVPKLIELLHLLSQEKLDDGSEFFPPSHLVISSVDVGNPAPNVIPAHAEALLNVRFNDLWTAKTLEAHLRRILDGAGVIYQLKGWCNAECFITTDEAWRDLVRSSIEALSGKAPVFNMAGGTSDARFIAPFCPVVEYGCVNETIHHVDEYVKLSEIEELTETYLLILRRYFSS